MKTAFYCVCDSHYFLGAVALLNSLRLLGHREPFIVLDSGLDRTQRELLRPYATLIKAPASSPAELLKWHAPLNNPADVMVLCDADVIITRCLDDLMSTAAAGKVVAFADGLSDRFFPAWGELLGLGPLRQHTYVNAGLLILPGKLGVEVLKLVQNCQRRIDLSHSVISERRITHGTWVRHPFYFPDQDVLNAVLAAHTQAAQVVVLGHRLAPFVQFERDLFLADESTLACGYPDGTKPVALHHILKKPWLSATRSSVYSMLLPRLWLAPDVALRLDRRQLPRRFRPGTLASLERRGAEHYAFLRDLYRRLRGRARRIVGRLLSPLGRSIARSRAA